ncbi:hypothetical protein Taro_052945, partial [Colocasia esculenta]|nr:hypothetical protein [Colocasia esculenta]
MSTRSAQGHIRRFPVRHPNSSPEAWSRTADAIAYGHPFAQMGITFRSIWEHDHRRYSHPLRFIPTPSVKELGITFRPGIRIVYVTTIRNRYFETVDKALVSWNLVLGPKFRRRSCVLVHRLSYSLGRTRIFVHPMIGTARKAPIRNRHFDSIGT